jgi:hypothetical protein
MRYAFNTGIMILYHLQGMHRVVLTYFISSFPSKHNNLKPYTMSYA